MPIKTLVFQVGSPRWLALVDALAQYHENMGDIPEEEMTPKELDNFKAAGVLIDEVNAEYTKLAEG